MCHMIRVLLCEDACSAMRLPAYFRTALDARCSPKRLYKGLWRQAMPEAAVYVGNLCDLSPDFLCAKISYDIIYIILKYFRRFVKKSVGLRLAVNEWGAGTAG